MGASDNGSGAAYRMTELGELPADWETATVREKYIFTQKPRTLRYDAFETIPFVPMELIPFHKIAFSGYLLKKPSAISSGTFFEAGDILLPKITPSFENGKQGIIPELPNGFGVATTEVIPIKQIDGVSDKGFLFFYLLREDVRRELAGKMEGSTGRQRLPRAVVENLRIPFPPLPEQRAIAAVLSTIQRAIEAQDKVIAAARELKKSLMRHLFTYGPVPVAEAARVTLKETEIGSVPEHWQVPTMGQLVSRGGGSIQTGPFGSMLHASDYTPDGVPFIMPKDLTPMGTINTDSVARIGKDDYQRLARYHLRTGDLLVGRRGEIGRRGLVTLNEDGWVCGSGCLRIRPGNALDPSFLSQAFESPSLRNWLATNAIGTTMANLSAEITERLPIPCPSIDEQGEIASGLKAADEKIEVEEKRKKAVETLFKTALHLLMTGQVRVG